MTGLIIIGSVAVATYVALQRGERLVRKLVAMWRFA